MRKHLILAGLLLVGIPFSADAKTLYQWKDSNGNTHFSDQAPPPGSLEIKLNGVLQTTQPTTANVFHDTESRGSVTTAGNRDTKPASPALDHAEQIRARDKEEERVQVLAHECGVKKKSLQKILRLQNGETVDGSSLDNYDAATLATMRATLESEIANCRN